jgi:hypothetical protein
VVAHVVGAALLSRSMSRGEDRVVGRKAMGQETIRWALQDTRPVLSAEDGEDAIPRGNQIIFLFLIKYGTTTLLRLPFFLGIFLAVLPVVGICNNCQRRTSFDPAADFQGAQIYLVFLLIILFLKKLMIFFS